MSFLGDELARQMQTHKMSGLQLAERTKISPSQIYNWVKGVQTSISAAQLDILAPALSNDLLDHANLVHAHLLDEKFGPGSQLIRIEIDSEHVISDKPKSSTKGEKALNFLAEERLTSRNVNDLIIDLARCLGAEI